MPTSRDESHQRSGCFYWLMVAVAAVITVAVVGGIVNEILSSREESRAKGILRDAVEEAVGVVEPVLIESGYLKESEQATSEGECLHEGGIVGGYVTGFEIRYSATWRTGPQVKPDYTLSRPISAVLEEAGFIFRYETGYSVRLPTHNSTLVALGIDRELVDSGLVGEIDLKDAPDLYFVMVRPDVESIIIALISRCAG